MTNPTRREWLEGLKEGDFVVRVCGDDRWKTRIIGISKPIIYLRDSLAKDQLERFRCSDGYKQGRCLCSPRPRIEPVEGGAK